MTIRRIDSGFRMLLLMALLVLCAPAFAQETGTMELEGPRNRLQTFADRASELAMRAMGMIGVRYKYGGGTPENGLDCSGLVGYVFKEAWGVTLPRTSEEISKVGKRIEADDLQPGDLVFYNTLRRSFSHVGIYLGDKKFIHSPASGGHVRIESMDVSYWKKRFNGARRISDPDQKFQGAAPGLLQAQSQLPVQESAATPQNLAIVPFGP